MVLVGKGGRRLPCACCFCLVVIGCAFSPRARVHACLLFVQPHDSWERVTKETQLDPQTFLQLALENYVCVGIGDELVLNVARCSMTVDVVSTRPKAPICSLFAGTTHTHASPPPHSFLPQPPWGC